MVCLKNIFIIVITLCIFDSGYAQSLDLKVKDSKRKQERIRKREIKDSIANSFENFGLEENQDFASMIERRFIKKGDSVRIRFVFDSNTKMISSRNLGLEIPYECLKKGEWILTVRPDSTQWIDYLHQGIGRPLPGGFLIIVIDPEKYDDVKREYDKVKDDYAKRQDFLDSLAGGKTSSEYFIEELKRAGYNIP